MTNKKSLRDKYKLDEVFRTDLPRGQAVIPTPPKIIDKVKIFGFCLLI